MEVFMWAKGIQRGIQKKIEQWIKEGRGQGEGKEYKPWLTIQDFPSMGRVTRVFGWTTQRIHHFFSQIRN